MIDFAEFKKFFLFNLIGALIISAVTAIITVLFGEFNEVTLRVFLTLFMVIIHSLVSLVFIWDNSKQNTFERLAFFTNILFLIIVLSFITSILGIWKILPGDIVWRIYSTFFVMGFASLHSDILSKAMKKETYMDIIIYINYLFILIVVLMLLPVIYITNSFTALGEVYYRFLAAAAIVDGTLSILTIIFHKLYTHKHPQVENTLYGGQQGQKQKKKGLSLWVWILIIYLILQVGLPILLLIFLKVFVSRGGIFV